MELNLNKELNKVLSNINLCDKPNLFLHVCCGPCSTAVLDKLNNYFNIFLIFYNSNIDTLDEFNLRYLQLKNVISYNNYAIDIIYHNYDHNEYLDYVKGFENCEEGGNRCEKCFELRLKKTYEIALDYINKHCFNDKTNYLCTTLSISPHKNASLIETIGEKICNNSDILKYLPSDFKKENGYLNSINLSKIIGLYRQNYCGCEFSKCIK